MKFRLWTVALCGFLGWSGLFGSAFVPVAQAKSVVATNTTTLNLTGMTCGGCVSMVTTTLKAVKGVVKVNVTLEPQRAVVTFIRGTTNSAQLVQVIKKAGYGATIAVAAAKKKAACGPDCKCKACKNKKDGKHKGCGPDCKCAACTNKKKTPAKQS